MQDLSAEETHTHMEGELLSHTDPVLGSGELSDRETGESTLLFEPALSIIEGVEKADRLDMVNWFLIDRWRPQ